MAKLLAALVIIYFATFLPDSARADTDYRCLNDCVHTGGNSASACISQCSYTPPASTQNLQLPLAAPQQNGADANTPLLSSHNQFAPLVPATGYDAPAKAPPPPSIDYACLQQCERSGLQYQLCQQNCIKPAGISLIPPAPLTLQNQPAVSR